MKIPFNKPHLTGNELKNIEKAHSLGKLSGDGIFTKKCQNFIEKNIGCKKALLTHSCTAALEMMAMIIGIKPGDEVIMPSYTFVSTANAFVLRGAKVVFVDVDETTFNIVPSLFEKAINKNTKAVVVVHYAGISCDMDKIVKIARKNNLVVLEDAAQAFGSKYKDKFLGTIGDLGAFSFHETKNITSGEGGALLINNSKYISKAEIIREKGTDRAKFFRGEVDKYTWVSIGSSYLPGEIVAAFLYAQLKRYKSINHKRLQLWKKYKYNLSFLEKAGYLRLPKIPTYNTQNAHMFYIVTKKINERSKLIKYLKECNIMSVFHYVPLHSSKEGLNCGKTYGSMKNTEIASNRLLRLPLYFDLTIKDVNNISKKIIDFYI